MSALCTRGLRSRRARPRRRAHRTARRGARRRGRRCSAAMLLFIGHSLRTMTGERRPQRPARLAGPGGLATRRPSGSPRRSPASPASLQASPAATAPFAGVEPRRRRRHDPHRAGRDPRGAAAATSRTSTPSASCTARCGRAGRPRPAAGGDAAGADRRHGHADAPRPAPSRSATGQRRRAGDGAGPALPAAQPAARARRRRSRPANVAIMPLGTFARTLAPALRRDHAGDASAARPCPAPRPACSGRCRRRSTRRRSAPAARAQALEARRPDPQPRWSARCPARCSSSTTSPTRSNTAAGRRALRADALHHARRARARWSRSGSPTWPRSARRARPARPRPAARPRRAAGAICSRWRRPRASRSASSPASLGAGLAFARGPLLVAGRRRPDAQGGRSSPRWSASRSVFGAGAGALGCHRVACVSPDGRRGPAQRARERARRSGRRYYLDLAALALSGLIYWLTARTGFSAVVNPDSNPTLSLSVYMFFAPALLWIGATLLLVRLRGRGLAWRGPSRRGRATGGSLRVVPARERRPPRRGDQPRPGRRRAAARLRRQPRRSSRPPTTSRPGSTLS